MDQADWVVPLSPTSTPTPQRIARVYKTPQQKRFQKTPTVKVVQFSPTTRERLPLIDIKECVPDVYTEGCDVMTEFLIKFLIKIYAYENATLIYKTRMEQIRESFKKIGIYNAHPIYGMVTDSENKENKNKEAFLSIVGIVGTLQKNNATKAVIGFRGTVHDNEFPNYNLDAKMTPELSSIPVIPNTLDIFQPLINLYSGDKNTTSVIDSTPKVQVHKGFLKFYTTPIGLRVAANKNTNICYCATPCSLDPNMTKKTTTKIGRCVLFPPSNISRIDNPCRKSEHHFNKEDMTIRCNPKTHVGKSMQEQLRTIMKYKPFSKVTEWIFCGHSLGATAATLAMFQKTLSDRKSGKAHDNFLMTFASPKVGNYYFKKMFEDALGLKHNTIRYYNTNDPVPSLPYASTRVYFGKYDHVGTDVPLKARRTYMGSMYGKGLYNGIIDFHSLPTYLEDYKTYKTKKDTLSKRPLPSSSTSISKLLSLSLP